jgi:hypothetical protein
VSQFDVLNPTQTHPLNPDYGFQKKRPLTHLNAKAAVGLPYFREITDTGHQFSLNWNDRMASTARKLKWYYEQYRNGFFTLIDHEGGGREYVGRFSQPVEPQPTSHNHWSVQQVLFDEIPKAPMLIYPNDWQNDAVWGLLLNDFGDRMVAAVSGTWTLATDTAAKSGYHFSNAGTVTTDQACYVYAGYGFQFWAPTGAALGKATVYLDGVSAGTVDFYSATSMPSSMLLQVQNVSLGLHTVILQPLHAKNASSSGYTVLWDALKVMR